MQLRRSNSSQSNGAKAGGAAQEQQVQVQQQQQQQQPVGESAVIYRRLSCLYTKQVQKKRKAWRDGVLQVSICAGTYSCRIIDAGDLRGIGLETRQLEPLEIQHFLNETPFTLAMDQHLVELTFEKAEQKGRQQDASADNAQPQVLKLKKFTPPSRVVRPPPAPVPISAAPSSFGSSGYSNSSHRNPVGKVSLDAELDELWGLSNQGGDAPPSDLRDVAARGSSLYDNNSNLPSNRESSAMGSSLNRFGYPDGDYDNSGTVGRYGSSRPSGAPSSDNRQRNWNPTSRSANTSPCDVPAQRGSPRTTLHSAKVLSSSRKPKHGDDFCDWMNDDSFANVVTSSSSKGLDPVCQSGTGKSFAEIDESIWG